MAKLGTHAGWSGKNAETLTAAKTFGSTDSGKVFFITTTSTFTNYLPENASAGYELTLIAAANIAADIKIIAQNSKSIYGNVVLSDDAAGVSGTSALNIEIKFTSSSVIGDMIKLYTDGSDWFVSGQAKASGALAFIGA